MVDVLQSSKFNQSKVFYLRQLISQHNRMYVALFNDNLKPKHHFLTHYPTVIQYSGPPKNYWCFRFEGKHKELKMYARSTCSRKNITLTLAKKFQFKFANFLLQPNIKNIVVNPKHSICSLHFEDISKIIHQPSTTYMCYSQVNYLGTLYKRGYYLTKFLDEMCLYEISEIIVVNNSTDKIFILSKQIQVLDFHVKFEAFEVDKNIIVNNCTMLITKPIVYK